MNHERLSGFLIEKGFTRGKLDTTLFLMFDGKDMLIVQIYVDDIIFGSVSLKVLIPINWLINPRIFM